MKKLILENINDLSLKHTFECGQCFRWQHIDDVTFFGIVKANAVTAHLNSNSQLELSGVIEDDEAFWRNYFDLNIDYQRLVKDLKGIDSHLKKAVETYHGLRLLKQEFFETVISFIISANNNITRIKGIISRLSEKAGDRIGENAYAFPNRTQLMKVSEDELRELGCGYRASYIYHAARELEDMEYKDLLAMDIGEQRKLLMNITGIGPKVADCVLLFSDLNKEAFPADVWVKRIMNQVYSNGEKEMSLKQIYEFAGEHFGNNLGYAQQFLFHYFRNL